MGNNNSSQLHGVSVPGNPSYFCAVFTQIHLFGPEMAIDLYFRVTFSTQGVYKVCGSWWRTIQCVWACSNLIVSVSECPSHRHEVYLTEKVSTMYMLVKLQVPTHCGLGWGDSSSNSRSGTGNAAPLNSKYKEILQLLEEYGKTWVSCYQYINVHDCCWGKRIVCYKMLVSSATCSGNYRVYNIFCHGDPKLQCKVL